MAELQRAQQRSKRNRRFIGIGVVVAVFLAIAIYVGVSGSGSSKKTTTTATTAAPAGGKITGATPCPKADGSSKRITSFSQAPPNCLDAGKTYTATFTTNEGNVTVALDTTKTPKTANNFVVLARYHYYDGTQIFRTDTSIDIIQGGAPTTESASDPGPGYTIPDEGSGYKYAAGDLVMARTSAPNSAGAQYFFCTGPACSNLNSQGTYVTFAHTTAGLPVLQKIIGLSTGSGSLGGAPSTPVTVKSVTITES
jgi:cyclophilin family peptidyl-prolyl cis-trans isomerase